MIAALFDIVNAAIERRTRRDAMGVLPRNPDPTQTGKSWMQILHGATRRWSPLAWPFVVRSDRRGAATFTQGLQNEESL
jgi:hypothetical protein